MSPKGAIMIKRFLQDEEGLTAIEYAIIALGIFIVIIVAVTQLGAALPPILNKVAASL